LVSDIKRLHLLISHRLEYYPKILRDCQGERIKKKVCEKRIELVISEGKKYFINILMQTKKKAKL